MRRHGMRSDDGAVGVIVAVLLIVFIALGALAVDAGFFFNIRRQLQAAADAAALAGCQELIASKDPAKAEAAARDYAARNSVPPADALVVQRVDVGSDYVQVTVSKQSTLYLGRALTSNAPNIFATSRAKVAPLVGVGGLQPWFMSVMVPKSVRVEIPGVGGTDLSQSGQRAYSGGWNPSVSTPVSTQTKGNKTTRTVTGVRVDLVARNEFYQAGQTDGTQYRLQGASSIVVLPSDSPIDGVSLSRQFFFDTSGDRTFTVHVTTNGRAGGVPSVTFAGHTVTASPNSAGAVNYTATFSAPWSVGQYGVSVSVQESSATASFAVNDAAVVTVARTLCPFQDLQTGPTCFAGGCGSTLYRATMMGLDGFVAGEAYDLKVDTSLSTAGNFGGILLGGSGGNVYRDNVRYGCDTVISIGQRLPPKTGNLVGPTSQGLSDRYAGDSCTYGGWLSAGRPGCPRLVLVPMCEWTGPINGASSDVIVRGFAAFFVEGSAGSTCFGRFVQYIAPGIPGEGPPPFDRSLVTPRLTSEGVTY